MVAQCPESTVVAEYSPAEVRSDFYQSEADLEKAFIKQLCSQGYEYADIHEEKGLVANLRRQLELLNNYSFSDKEWKQFFTLYLANANDHPDKTVRTHLPDSHNYHHYEVRTRCRIPRKALLIQTHRLPPEYLTHIW